MDLTVSDRMKNGGLLKKGVYLSYDNKTKYKCFKYTIYSMIPNKLM